MTRTLPASDFQMSDARYAELMHDETLELTAEEMAAGFHFCPEFDGLLCIAGNFRGVLRECHCDQD